MILNEKEMLLLRILREAGQAPLTAREVAEKMFETTKPDAKQVRAVRNAMRRPKKNNLIETRGRGAYVIGLAGTTLLKKVAS